MLKSLRAAGFEVQTIRIVDATVRSLHIWDDARRRPGVSSDARRAKRGRLPISPFAME
jgi:hypothetical protein